MRKLLQVAVAAVALGASGLASADGVIGRVASKSREQAQTQRAAPRQESRPQPRQESRPQARQEPRPQPGQESRPPRNEQRLAPPKQEPRPAPRENAGGSQERSSRGVAGRIADRAGRDNPRNGNSRNEGARRPDNSPPPAASPPPAQAGTAPRASKDRGVIGRVIEREYKDRDPRPEHRPGTSRPRPGPDRPRPGNHRPPHRHVHVVHHLPPGGYRDYWWNGAHYYYYDGFWYQPWGTSYISVRVPYGFFVTSLPGGFTSVWVDGTRYYYSDYHYYVYEPERRGYVVVPSPYGDDEEDDRVGQELFIYPAQGQDEAQQAQDRYECHRWAVDQTGYDPLDDEYDADLYEDYLRAMTACLTGRGYTVR